MRYVGSKGRYVRYIVPILMAGHDQSRPYIEPFCGGGNMLSAVPARMKWGNDQAQYAVALLKAVSEGYAPPMRVSEEMYRQVRANPEGYPPELVGFIMYSMSFGAKAWGGWARDRKDSTRNYAAEGARSLIRQMGGLRGCHFTCLDYRQMEIPDGATVYCDPPYAGTYDFYGETFDSVAFWEWVEATAQRCRVFVSEYTAPPQFQCVWAKMVPATADNNRDCKWGMERLFRCHTS